MCIQRREDIIDTGLAESWNTQKVRKIRSVMEKDLFQNSMFDTDLLLSVRYLGVVKE